MALDSSRNKLDGMLDVLNWLDWLGLTIALMLLCVLILLIWRRKLAKEESKFAPPVMTVPAKHLLPHDCLIKVWRGFISAIPRRLRANALSVPLSLVIGEAGSGKTGIIDRYADWQGQEFSFHPSFIDDPLLQIYLGSKALVLEFGATLLYDTSAAAYRAINKLWWHLPPSPQAVMVINAGTLLSPQTEFLRQSGQALFGKLKIFSELESKPLPLILAISHMDKVPGFVEFCIFLEEAGIPLQIDFPNKDGINRLDSCLDSFQEHLQRALVTRPAQDYLKIVTFLNEAPRLLKVLVDFLRVAGLENDLAAPPVVRLCLMSEHVHSFGCHPFAPESGRVKQALISLNSHAKAALVLLSAGLLYLIGGYRYQQDLETEVYKNINTVRDTPVEYYAEKISPLFLNYSADLNKNALLAFMPSYFIKIDDYLKYLLIVEIRKYYLLPLLKQIQLERNANFKTIRLLGLLYSTSTNEVSKIITKKPEKYSIDMEKYGLLFKDYINYNSHTDELDNLLNTISYTEDESDVKDQTQWLVLFRNFREMLKKPFITQAEFTAMQQQLTPFLDVIGQFDYYSDQVEIGKWLIQHTNLNLNYQIQDNIQSELRQKSISQLLNFVSHLQFSDAESCPVSLSLNECLRIAQTVANDKTAITSSEMEFTLSGEYFSFSPKQWLEFMVRSRISMILRNFINSRSDRDYDGWIFFKAPSMYRDLELNSSNNGRLLFAGKAGIDGRLTADAFEQNVKLSVMALSDIVAKLPIDAYEKKNFGEFVLKNLATYSNRYVSSYLNFFRQFQVRIDSPWGLNYVLDDLQQPNSQLLEVLVQIKNNTALNLSASPNFKAFAQKLTVFNFIQHLMEEKNGDYPEFQKYQTMMAQMQQEINSLEPYVPKKSGDDAASLKGALSPIGRLAWAMLLNEDSSYSALVKSWLQNAGIPANWQQPFLAPVLKVAEFGTAEINQNIAYIWSDIWKSNVVPLLDKFPFAADAGRDKELALDDLTKTFHPKQGVFWVTFQQYLSPLLGFNNGVWVKRQQLFDRLDLPENYLQRLNAVQQFTANLWDEQGNPKPLQLSIKPGLLPTFDNNVIPHAPLVSLSYLRAGGISVLGFNQQADWQKFPLEWWTAKPAQVGMEFRKDADPIQVYTDITVDGSPWSFFRLLQQGQFTGTQRYRWRLAHPNFPQQPLNLDFSFQANPLSVFADLARS